MNSLEYIESYFLGTLSEADKKAFEERCESDSSFAEDVSIYIVSRQHLKQTLRQQKKDEFIQQFHSLSVKENLTDTGKIQKHWWGYISAAAACVAIFIVYFTFFKNPSPEAIASNYIDKNFNSLSITMGNAEDSLQVGIAAFNNGEYHTAEQLFISLGKHDDLASETAKYLGITYLKTGQYDKAIEQFNKLETYIQLFNNPAKFYRAVTLMKRSADGDVVNAKKLLHEVVDEKLSGYQEASAWLEGL